ncbi:MAG: reverse transcriptase/maturase family protein [Nanoarchaeota archaeon]|nr:reverse transcriptase/maturase family protein [Nanoarchaeota archaeon]
MKTYKNLYEKIYSYDNLYLAYRNARKGKTKRPYVKEFEENLENNLIDFRFELITFTYSPRPLDNFILKDPKTRKISRSHFRDRIIHHAIINVIREIFEKRFIHDSCANQLGKGNLFSIKRFETFRRKVTKNFTSKAFCLKADVKHYFQEVDHEILIKIIKNKIKDKKVVELIRKILKKNASGEQNKGMPLGNLTSQFFANVYLNELDYFIKYQLKAKYYIRYVDDFVILHQNREQLNKWKKEIEKFLAEKLMLELHPQKSKVISLSKGVDFVGFRNFYHFKLLRKRNLRSMLKKIDTYRDKLVSKEKMMEIFQGWNAYAKWANTYNLRKSVLSKINKINKLNLDNT